MDRRCLVDIHRCAYIEINCLPEIFCQKGMPEFKWVVRLWQEFHEQTRVR